MKIAIGCDHRGFQLKQKLIELLKSMNHDVIDEGTHDTRAIDYPDIAC